MAGGRADTYDQRADIFGRIVVRNRVVDGLRIIVPLIGAAAFLFLAAQIYIANTLRQYGVSGIRIDRGDVVVEAPRYSGTGKDGARYLVTASEARTPIDNRDRIDLTDATLDLIRNDDSSYHAQAASATMDTVRDVTTAPGTVAVSGSDGLAGTLTDVEVDTGNERVTSYGPVDLKLADGTTIVASTMVRDGKTQTFTFTRATVVVPDLPEAAE